MSAERLSLVVWLWIGLSVLSSSVWISVLSGCVVTGGLLVFVLLVSELFVLLGVGFVLRHCRQVCWCCL